MRSLRNAECGVRNRQRRLTGIVLVLVIVLGCSSTPKVPGAPPSAAGPQVSSQPAATPKIEVKSAGPATVEAPTRADTSTEAARPEVAVAPKADVTGQLFQQIDTKVTALQKSVDATNSAIASMETKIGTVQGDMKTVATSFDLSANQLAAFDSALKAVQDAHKQAEAAQAASESIWKKGALAIVLILIGLGLIAKTLPPPTSVIARYVMFGVGVALLFVAPILAIRVF